MNKDPKKRPTLKDIKKDPFFADIDWEKLLRKEVNPPMVLSKENLKKDEVEEKMAAPKDKKEMEELVNNIT